MDGEFDPALVRGEFDGVGQQVKHYLFEAVRVHVQHGQRCRRLEDYHVFFRLDLRHQHLYDLAGEFGRRMCGRIQGHGADVNLGEIEQIADHQQQVIAGAENPLQIIPLSLAKFAMLTGQKDVGKTNDGAQRGFQFVADIGEETAFVLVGFL